MNRIERLLTNGRTWVSGGKAVEQLVAAAREAEVAVTCRAFRDGWLVEIEG